MSTLRRGSRGEKVQTLQYLLNLNLTPDPNMQEDGIFGSQTEANVKRFQAQEFLKADGVVGPKTWAELGDLGLDEIPMCGPMPPWMSQALRELENGVRETWGNQHNPRILEYHQATSLRATTDETAWCSAFANWCMQRCGFAGTNRANARSWLSWGDQLPQPRYGSVVIFWRESRTSWKGHVGFYVGERGAGRVLVLGGNQGNAVSIGAYPKTRLLGSRWPGQFS